MEENEFRAHIYKNRDEEYFYAKVNVEQRRQAIDVIIKHIAKARFELVHTEKYKPTTIRDDKLGIYTKVKLTYLYLFLSIEMSGDMWTIENLISLKLKISDNMLNDSAYDTVVSHGNEIKLRYCL